MQSNGDASSFALVARVCSGVRRRSLAEHPEAGPVAGSQHVHLYVSSTNQGFSNFRMESRVPSSGQFSDCSADFFTVPPSPSTAFLSAPRWRSSFTPSRLHAAFLSLPEGEGAILDFVDRCSRALCEANQSNPSALRRPTQQLILSGPGLRRTDRSSQ